MNIEQAKTIPISAILDVIDCKPVRSTNTSGTYLSPIRDERNASFQVSYTKNCWFDHGIDKGGDGINLVCLYLNYINENDTVSDALRWLKNMCGFVPPIRDVAVADNSAEDKKLVIKSVEPIEELGLKRYLEKRGIKVEIAKQYLKEVDVYNKDTKKNMFALGLKNEEDGYELRNPFFKGCVGHKSITFIRGKTPKPDGIHLFEGMMDYLSFVTIKGKNHNDDVIILNSIACLREAAAYIKNYGYKIGYTWMDNDKAGMRATTALRDFFESEPGLKHKTMNKVYQSHKDLNAWHMHNLNLKL